MEKICGKEWCFNDEYILFSGGRKLRRSFSASKDNRTNFVTVRFTHASPIFARDFVMAASEMNNIIRESDFES